MSVGRYETSLAIVQQAAVECGLASPTVAFASTDANVVLLRTLLNSCGRELCMMRPWRHLVKDGSLTAAAAVAPAVYGVNTLPTDYDYLFNDTVYDDTTDEQLIGPVSEQEWEFHRVHANSPSPAIWRLEGNSLWLYEDAAGDTITFKYISRYWVKASGQSAPNLTASTADTDTVHHHPVLITRLLKLRYMQARGMDTTAALVDYETTYGMVAGLERPAPVLSLASRGGIKMLDWTNFSDSF